MMLMIIVRPLILFAPASFASGLFSLRSAPQSRGDEIAFASSARVFAVDVVTPPSNYRYVKNLENPIKHV